jgi:hypothetical protein
MSEREKRLDLPKSAIGWGRTGQDAAAESPLVLPSAPETGSALDRHIGYVTLRWALVAAGGVVGAIAGFVLGIYDDRALDMPGSGVEWPLALAGFAVGCVPVALVLLLMHVKSILSRGSRRERLADWFFLR